jgi:hypothetical protein
MCLMIVTIDGLSDTAMKSRVQVSLKSGFLDKLRDC